MPGSGKSAIGKATAKRLALSYADCDQAIERRAGCSIADFFAANGEQAFRDLESDMLATLVDDARSVIATGGGVVLSEANRDLMRSSGTVVYLKARLENLWERTRHDSTRPLLATPNPRARLAELLAEREPLYQEAAHVVVETGQQSPATAVGRVLAALRELSDTWSRDEPSSR